MENQVRRALVSVYDKTGLEGFVRLLVQRGVEVLSTGGTYKALRAAGIAVREVSEVTQFPRSCTGASRPCIPGSTGGSWLGATIPRTWAP
jgi:phosphoribosylaminoimidazolecarboxamide formyltransferase/IMP cyclohydrolase